MPVRRSAIPGGARDRAAPAASRCGFAAAFIAGVATAAAPAAAPATSSPAKTDAYLEIRSPGEEARDVIELLVPLFAKLNFTERLRKTDALSEVTTTSFLASNGDFIGVAGRRSCVVVAFTATRHPTAEVARGVRDRAADLSAQIRSFLAGLPTPRPVAREVPVDVTPQCWRWGASGTLPRAVH